MLNHYLDDKIDRKSCKTNEKKCENCENEKTKKEKNITLIDNKSMYQNCILIHATS